MPPTPRPHGPKKKANVKLPNASSRGIPTPFLIGAAGLVAVVVVLGVVLFGRGGNGGSSTNAPALLRAAGCSFQTVTALPDGDHSVTVATGTSTRWNTSPPTSGPHYEVPAIWGSYTEPLLPAQVVHNLEHGGIFIHYGSKVPRATIDQLQVFYDSHQNGTLLAPLPSLGTTIALGVWVTDSASTPDTGEAHLAKCRRFDEKAYSAFFDAYQFKGPERFPESALKPGS